LNLVGFAKGASNVAQNIALAPFEVVSVVSGVLERGILLLDAGGQLEIGNALLVLRIGEFLNAVITSG